MFQSVFSEGKEKKERAAWKFWKAKCHVSHPERVSYASVSWTARLNGVCMWVSVCVCLEQFMNAAGCKLGISYKICINYLCAFKCVLFFTCTHTCVCVVAHLQGPVTAKDPYLWPWLHATTCAAELMDEGSVSIWHEKQRCTFIGGN